MRLRVSGQSCIRPCIIRASLLGPSRAQKKRRAQHYVYCSRRWHQQCQRDFLGQLYRMRNAAVEATNTCMRFMMSSHVTAFFNAAATRRWSSRGAPPSVKSLAGRRPLSLPGRALTFRCPLVRSMIFARANPSIYGSGGPLPCRTKSVSRHKVTGYANAPDMHVILETPKLARWPWGEPKLTACRAR